MALFIKPAHGIFTSLLPCSLLTCWLNRGGKSRPSGNKFTLCALQRGSKLRPPERRKRETMRAVKVNRHRTETAQTFTMRPSVKWHTIPPGSCILYAHVLSFLSVTYTCYIRGIHSHNSVMDIYTGIGFCKIFGMLSFANPSWHGVKVDVTWPVAQPTDAYSVNILEAYIFHNLVSGLGAYLAETYNTKLCSV